MIKIIIFLLFAILNLRAETVKVHVPGMVCQMCVQGMQKQFESTVNNVQTDIKVDLEKKNSNSKNEEANH